jgi:hypothetical protein
VHFDPDEAIALAVFTAASFIVKGKSAGIVAANARGRELAEEISNRTECARVGRWIGAGGAADRALVNDYDFVELLNATDGCVSAGARFGSVEISFEGDTKDVVYQGAA